MTHLNLTSEEIVDLYISTREEIYFEMIYDCFSGKVFRKCLSILGEHSTAEDATQEIFLKIYTKISSFSGKSKFGTWLYSITYNHCIDYLKYKSKRYTELEESHMDFDTIEEVSDSGLLEMKVNTLKDVLNNLKAEERVVLLMKYQDDKSIRDISHELDIGESAVKMRIKRAKQKAHHLLKSTKLEYVY